MWATPWVAWYGSCYSKSHARGRSGSAMGTPSAERSDTRTEKITARNAPAFPSSCGYIHAGVANACTLQYGEVSSPLSRLDTEVSDVLGITGE